MRRYLFLLFAFTILAFILMEIIDDWYYERRRPNCSDFLTQEDAQQHFNEGNRRLDGDKDGIACEDLPPKAEAINLDLAF